ncbi:AI-2E family transporter [Pseudanabaena sp. FACHB-2040]|nr:AI-2E family transporter [Pseudanabaena sp. FACHB-2040]
MRPLEKLPRWLIWEIAIPLTILNGWLFYKLFQTFQAPIALLVTATLLSFLLNYPIELLMKQGLKRGFSVLIIFLLTLGGIALLGALLVPILVTQLTELANKLPVWLDSGGEQFQALDQWLMAHQIPLDTSALVAGLADALPEELGQLPDQVLELVTGAADSVIGILVTVVLTLYMLLHGREFWYGLIRWLPGNWGLEVRVALKEQFKNYFVGQATVAGLMAATLTTVFFLLKIPFWLVLGLSIGGLVLIPFGDTVAVLVASLLLSFQSLWLGLEVFVVTLVIDQLIDNGVAPRILGNLVGVNPVWVILSLLVGAQFGGVLGLVIAVPLAGSIKRIFNDLLPFDELTIEGESS